MVNSPPINRSPRHPSNEQAGVALTESLVLCLVLLPLLYLLIAIGDIIDIRQTTEQASRYLAWEQSVRMLGDTQDHVEARFFKQPYANIQSDSTKDQRLDSLPESNFRLWHVAGNKQSKQAVRGQGSAVPGMGTTVSFAQGAGATLERSQASSDVARSWGQSVTALGGALDFIDQVDWDMPADGTVSAGMQINILSSRYLPSSSGNAACNGAQEASVFTCVAARNSIMVDSWDVATQDRAESRTRALVPATVLNGVGQALSHLGKIPLLQELSGLEYAFGRVDSTQLPLDRYSGNQYSGGHNSGDHNSGDHNSGDRANNYHRPEL